MPTPLRVLLVNDDPDTSRSVCSELKPGEFQVRATCSAEGWAEFRSKRPDLVISDIQTPSGAAIELLRRIRQISDVPVVMLAARAEVETAVAAMREGANDLVCLPGGLPALRQRVEALLPELRGSEPEDAALRWLPGSSPAVVELRGRIRSLAGLGVPVLVTGERGSGRLDAVRALHALSPQRVPLLEVGASDRELPKKRGALVLVDLSSWPAEAQEHWARALSDADARVVRLFATAESAVPGDRLGSHRDLWARVSRFRVGVPPLRARAPDIPMFAREALREIAAALGRPGLQFATGALDSLRKRPWPGNFPELREVITQAVAFAKRSRLDRDAVDEAVRLVIATRENSLASRRAERHNAEREQLIQLLSECRGNVAEIARRLGMTRGAVAYRLRKHGLVR